MASTQHQNADTERQIPPPPENDPVLADLSRTRADYRKMRADWERQAAELAEARAQLARLQEANRQLNGSRASASVSGGSGNATRSSRPA